MRKKNISLFFLSFFLMNIILSNLVYAFNVKRSIEERKLYKIDNDELPSDHINLINTDLPDFYGKIKDKFVEDNAVDVDNYKNMDFYAIEIKTSEDGEEAILIFFCEDIKDNEDEGTGNVVINFWTDNTKDGNVIRVRIDLSSDKYYLNDKEVGVREIGQDTITVTIDNPFNEDFELECTEEYSSYFCAHKEEPDGLVIKIYHFQSNDDWINIVIVVILIGVFAVSMILIIRRQWG